ncbi:hypothetical protein [Wukongibacter baidiensis]
MGNINGFLQKYVKYAEFASYLIGFLSFVIIAGIYYVKANGLNLKSKKKEVDYSKHKKVKATEFVDVDDIKKDMAIENNKRFTAGVQAFGFDYKTEDLNEQVRVQQNYINLFNTLEQPTQLFMTCKNIDVDFTIEMYEDAKERIINEIANLEEEVVNLQNTLSGLELDSDMLQKVERELEKKEKFLENKLWQAELMDHETAYVKAIASPDNERQQDVYYFTTYSHDASLFREKIVKDEVIDRGYDDTDSKCRSITNVLKRCKVNCKKVNGNDYAELFRRCYNPFSADIYKFKDVLKSNFFDLISTSDYHEVSKKKLVINETLAGLEEGGKIDETA